MTHSLTKLMFIAALAGSNAPRACETPIEMIIEGSKVVARFKVGDSRCSLIDGYIRCTHVSDGDVRP